MRTYLFMAFLGVAAPMVGGDPYRAWSHELAQAGYDDRAELLDLLISEEDKDLRFKAAHILTFDGRIEDAAVIEDVLREAGWSEKDRVALADVIAKLDRDRAIRIARGLLDELEEPEAHAAALRVLARLGVATRYDEILGHLESNDFGERQEAITALGYLAKSGEFSTLDPSPLGVLVDLTEDRRESVRWRAVFGLNAALRRAEGERRRIIVDALCKRSTSDSSEKVRRRAKLGLESESLRCSDLRESEQPPGEGSGAPSGQDSGTDGGQCH